MFRQLSRSYMLVMEEHDGEYLYRRAEAELEMAQKSTVTQAVKAHYELAERYMELIATHDGADAAEGAPA